MSDRECKNCLGCGKITDDGDGTPWKHWLELSIESSLAALSGLVKPLDCPVCNGTGRELTEIEEFISVQFSKYEKKHGEIKEREWLINLATDAHDDYNDKWERNK